MTNKLPVVCNKYKNKITGTIYKAFKHKARENCYFMESQSESPDLVVNSDSFWAEFEEFPEDKAEIKLDLLEKPKSVLSPEVEEAMEKLREEIKTRDWTISTKLSVEDYYRLKTSATNLLNALDKQFKLGEEK